MITEQKKGFVDVCVEVMRVTALAVRVTDGDVTEWVPKSQIDGLEEMNIGETKTISIPEWLAKEKGLI